MEADSGGEAIMICIDNSIRKPEYYEAQLEAVRSYATYKIQSDPRTVVGLTTSSRTPIHNPGITVLLDPTRDLNLIFDSFQRIVRGGKFDMIEAIVNCLAVLPFPFSDPPEKRIVMFAGGIISMPVEVADEFGTCLKKKGIAFDIVNFTLGDELGLRKKKLEAFVAAVNNNDNSHIIHVDDGSSLSNLLYSFMVKNKVLIPSKTSRLSKPLSMGVRPKFKVKETDLEAMETTERVGFKETAPLLDIYKSTVVNETREYVKSEESKLEKLKEQQFFVEDDDDDEEEEKEDDDEEEKERLLFVKGLKREIKHRQRKRKRRRQRQKPMKTKTEKGKQGLLIIFLGFLLILCLFAYRLVF